MFTKHILVQNFADCYCVHIKTLIPLVTSSAAFIIKTYIPKCKLAPMLDYATENDIKEDS